MLRHTADCGLLVFLEVVVNEPEDERGLVVLAMSSCNLVPQLPEGGGRQVPFRRLLLLEAPASRCCWAWGHLGPPWLLATEGQHRGLGFNDGQIRVIEAFNIGAWLRVPRGEGRVGKGISRDARFRLCRRVRCLKVRGVVKERCLMNWLDR